ncbi:hypothetical protein [Salinibacterium xinjiangense]|uniref:hypothetical protein n=1 Tax=Salinibacterium xinjiangense TaxID=386302 RepID=UPI001E62BD16|nr:hypothetical protein [Salinibacterium xinjiangense]
MNVIRIRAGPAHINPTAATAGRRHASIPGSINEKADSPYTITLSGQVKAVALVLGGEAKRVDVDARKFLIGKLGGRRVR